jgi:hypothetical protein
MNLLICIKMCDHSILYQTPPSYKFFYCFLLLPLVFTRCYFVLSNTCQTIYTKSAYSSYNFCCIDKPLRPSFSCNLSHKATIPSFKNSFQVYFLSEETTTLSLLSLQQVRICVRPVTDTNKHCSIHLSKQHMTHYHPDGTWPRFRSHVTDCEETNSYVYDNWHFTSKNSQLHSNKGCKSVLKDKARTAMPKNTTKTKVPTVTTLLPCTSLAIQPEENRWA